MKFVHFGRKYRPVMLVILFLGLAACGQQDDSAEPGASEGAKKIPITTASEEALALYMQGRSLFEDLHFTESREYFERAIEADPGFAMGHLMMANSSQSAAQFFESVANADAVAPNASEGEQLAIRALKSGSENNSEGQLAALNDLVAMYPQDERAHVALGNFYNGQQKFDMAVEHYNHAVKINDQFAVALNSLGYAQRAREDFDSAKQAFEQYIAVIPDEANPYDSYAELLMEMGDYDASIENYSKALAIDENFAASYAGISVNQSLKGNVELAQSAVEDMLRSARTPAEKRGAMFQAAVVQVYAGDTDAAITAAETFYNQAGTENNHAAMGGIRDYMGDMMMVEGSTEKANEHFGMALDHRMQANTNDAAKAQAKRTHAFKTAIAAMIAGDTETADALTAEYIAAAEADGTAFERRRAHELAGYQAMNHDDMETAAAELAQANQFEPIVLYWQAVAYNEIGNKDKARDLAERASTRNTLSPNLGFFRDEAIEMLEALDAEAAD